MSRQLSETELAYIKRSFISYLEGSAPLAIVQDPLDLMLRVEPPIYFTPKEIAETVASWALLRSHADGIFIHEYYINSVELIAAADHSRILTAFDPTRFYMAYFEGLVRSCPKEEKEAFRQKLKFLRERLATEWGYQFRRVEPTQNIDNSTTTNNDSSNSLEFTRSVNSTLSSGYSSSVDTQSFQNYSPLETPTNSNNYTAPNPIIYSPPSTATYPIAPPPSYPTGTLPPPDGYQPTMSNQYSINGYSSSVESVSPLTQGHVENAYISPNPSLETNQSFNQVPRSDNAHYESIFELVNKMNLTSSPVNTSSGVVENNYTQQVTSESVSSLINQLRRSVLKLSQQEQDNYLSELRRVFDELMKKTNYLAPHLEALIDISIITFNAEKGVFGAQLLYLVEQIYYQDTFDEYARHGLRRFRAATVLNEAYMRTMASDPELVSALRIYLAHFDELAPDVLLSYLTHETDRQKQRFWMLLIEAHKETAIPEIIKYLSQIEAKDETWPLIRNLISLIGRVPPQEKNAQRQALNLLGAYLKSPFIQLRYTTVTTLEMLLVDEALPHIIAAFDEKLCVGELEDKERLLAYLKTLVSLIGRFNSERALRLLVDISVSKYIDFMSGKALQQLQLQAMQLLAGKQHLLSVSVVAPIIERIRLITNPWKKLMSKFLGDTDTELLAMIEVIGMINTQEVKELLSEVKGQYANQAPGRRAGELLARL